MSQNFYTFKELPNQLGLMRRTKNEEKEAFSLQMTCILRISDFVFFDYKASFCHTSWHTKDNWHKQRSVDPIGSIASLSKTQDYSHVVTSQKLAGVKKQRAFISEQHC